MFDRETHSRPVLCPRNLCAYVTVVMAASLSAMAGCTGEPTEETGEFPTRFDDEERAMPPMIVNERLGEYVRRGDTVSATMEIEWQNVAPSLADFPLRVRLPFAPVLQRGGEISDGYVEVMQLDDKMPTFVWFASDDPSVPPMPASLEPVLDQTSGAAIIRGDVRSADNAPAVLAYGTGLHRVSISVTYQTTGAYQYQ